MTNDDLQAIRERWEKLGRTSVRKPLDEERFVAGAERDIPKLLAEVERLREENRKLHALIDGAAT